MENLLKAMRINQWVKNLIIFMPLVFGQKFFEFPVNLKVLIAFFLFSFMTSAVYITNDLIDVKEDSLHPFKKYRPIPHGKISIGKAKGFVLVLAVISTSLGCLLNFKFGFLLVGYLLLNLVYSLFLKKLVIIDIFCVGLFFLIRIIAGTVITNVEYSYWMIFMLFLLAMFLGFNKRRQEVVLAKENAASQRHVLTKYDPYFIDQMIAVTTSSIVVAYMLYTVDERTVSEFGTNHLIYSIPFVYYGIFRYLYVVHMKNMGEDPTSVVIKDLPMQANILIWFIICLLVIYFKI